MKIAIVILNWNGKHLLERFLPSVEEHAAAASIYVADNGSTDGSVAFVHENHPQLTVIENPQNYGYARGYNEALKNITADVYCLLNSDVAVTAGWLEPVIEIFERDSSVVVVQPKLLDYNRPSYFEYAGAGGGYIDALGYPFCRGRIFTTIEPDKGQYNDTRPVFWASGACFFVRSTVFKKLGGFDAAFGAHQEEIDFCWRAQRYGYKIFYTGASAVYHVGGATLASGRPEKTFLNFRNSLFSLLKNAPSHRVFPVLVVRFLVDIAAAGRFLFRGEWLHVYAVARAYVSFLAHFGSMFKKRNRTFSCKSYYRVKSIVWQYFIKGKKYFSDIDG